MSDDLNTKIRECAYAIWEKENRPEGRHLDHWLCAQAEIETEQSSVAGQPDHPAFTPTGFTDEGAAGSAPEGDNRARKLPS